MDDFAAHILRHLVEGHQARAGMKERNRALTEYEIARRAGYTDHSYVEFSTTPERDRVRGALDELEREGWITQWQRAGRYDTYVPTELGVRRANSLGITRDAEAASAEAPRPDDGQPVLTAQEALNRLVRQLDEALALLRAIDAKLGRDR
jgi:DNA-binding PadR family transcriptional regulator